MGKAMCLTLVLCCYKQRHFISPWPLFIWNTPIHYIFHNVWMWVCFVLPVEGLKVVEIEKCKNDLKKLRDEMTSRVGGRLGQSSGLMGLWWPSQSIHLDSHEWGCQRTCFLLLLLSSLLLVEPYTNRYHHNYYEVNIMAMFVFIFGLSFCVLINCFISSSPGWSFTTNQK